MTEGKETKIENTSWFLERINDDFTDMLKRALYLTFMNPRSFIFIIKAIFYQGRARKLRKKMELSGKHIPMFLIVSITRSCNLGCKGCYAMTKDKPREGEMSLEKIESLFREAESIGISISLLAGGEPLTKKGILDVTRKFPGIIFPLFTNGLLIDKEIVRELGCQRHVIPIISVEGNEKETDGRRGDGVHGKLRECYRMLRDNRLLWGASITVTMDNFDVVTSRSFVSGLINMGCTLFFYVEYVPVEGGTESLTLDEAHRALLLKSLDALRKKYPALFTAFPGDEESLGGCLAAGRGFAHINTNGSVEPCPFAAYSDCDINTMSLEKALESDLFKNIRAGHSALTGTRGGCALWENRDWVKSLLPSENDKI
jgi:MoaA/NifB/PqqE/SkfB family radical SAM enzyme